MVAQLAVSVRRRLTWTTVLPAGIRPAPTTPRSMPPLAIHRTRPSRSSSSTSGSLARRRSRSRYRTWRRRSAMAGRRSTRRRSGRPPSASCSSTSASPVRRLTKRRAGWGGDHAVVATGPDDAFAVAWRLAWDSPADAAEFVPRVRDGRGRPGLPGVCHRAAERRGAGRPRIDRGPAAARSTRRRLTYIDSGAEIPSRSRPLTSTERVASTSARRADDSASSSVSTLQSR